MTDNAEGWQALAELLDETSAWKARWGQIPELDFSLEGPMASRLFTGTATVGLTLALVSRGIEGLSDKAEPMTILSGVRDLIGTFGGSPDMGLVASGLSRFARRQAEEIRQYTTTGHP